MYYFLACLSYSLLLANSSFNESYFICWLLLRWAVLSTFIIVDCVVSSLCSDSTEFASFSFILYVLYQIWLGNRFRKWYHIFVQDKRFLLLDICMTTGSSPLLRRRLSFELDASFRLWFLGDGCNWSYGSIGSHGFYGVFHYVFFHLLEYHVPTYTSS